MNKLAVVLGVAAVATLAGCKDPNYKHMSSQDDVKTVTTQPGCKCPPGAIHTEPCCCGAPDCACIVEAPVLPPPPPPAPKCQCPAGTKHTSPCACGTSDCKCVVEKPLPPPPPPPPAEVTTIYIVQNGDYLAKISKKYNVTIASIKRINNLKDDNIRIGQKLKLPGKINVGEQKAPAKSASKEAVRKGYESYKGPTVDYVVKSGDTLGAVAYGHGCNIRQLKELNGLTGDALKVGQKLKVPANGKSAVVKNAGEQKKPVVEKPIEPASVEPVAAESAPAVEETVAAAEPAADVPDTVSYVVQEGDDLTGVSIRFCISPSVIRDLNNLAEDAKLEPGQVIKLPADAQQ